MNPLDSLSSAAAAIRARQIAPAELVSTCLAQIDRFEDRVHAWVLVDHEGARRAAERAGDEIARGRQLGPLHGIPLAIKDIVDVEGMPTRAGSPITDAGPARADAPVVARLRAAGAVILGKTVTTEFASFDPPPTRNPWNLARTPGGSSSGSAAALALGMCFGALGSQTGGSITRPASYCGVAGCKPTFGRVSRRGVFPLAFHLDHVGSMARTVADCALLLGVIAGYDPQDSTSVNVAPLPLDGGPSRSAPPRLGVMRSYFFEPAGGQAARITDAALDKLARAGAQIIELPAPASFEQAFAMHRRIMAAECADIHREQFAGQPERFGPQVAALINEGLRVSMADYQEALRQQRLFQSLLVPALAQVDALATPAATAGAPGAETTGDPRFNSIWSFAQLPTVTFPCGLDSDGMPLGLQLVGPAWSEAPLLATSAWCEEKIAFNHHPRLLVGAR